MDDDVYRSLAALAPERPAKSSEPETDVYQFLADQSKPFKPSEENLKERERLALRAGRTPEELAAHLKESGYSPDVIQSRLPQYQMQQAKQKYEGEVPGGSLGATATQFYRNAMPFGDLLDAKGHKDYYAAKKKFEAGDSSPDVVNAIARYERLQEIDQKTGESTLGGMIQGVGSVSKLFLEGAAAGKALGLVGRAAGGTGTRVGRFLTGERAMAPLLTAENAPLLQRFGSHAGRMALMTAGAPAFYVDEARQRNLDAGREPDDIRGYPGSFLHGYSNMLVLGSIANQFKAGAAKTLGGRVGRGVGVGIGEQQLADVAGGAWDEVVNDTWKTKTGYGVLGDMAKGNFGEAAHKLAVQAATFGAFAGLHEVGLRLDRRDTNRAEAKMKEVLDLLNKDLSKDKEAGVPVDVASERASDNLREVSMVRLDAMERARREGLGEESAIVEADKAEQEYRSHKGRIDWDNGWREAFKKAKADKLSDDSAVVEADRAMGDRPEFTPAARPAEAPVAPGARSSTEPAVDTRAAAAAEAAILKQKKAVYNRVYQEQIKKGRPIEVAKALAQQESVKVEVAARQKAAQPPVQAPPETPTIAPEASKVPPTQTSPGPEIAQPGATGGPVTGSELPKTAVIPQPAARVPTRTDVSQTPAQARESARVLIEAAIDSAPGLSDAQRIEHKANTRAIVAKLPDAAAQRLADNLRQVNTYPSTEALGIAVNEEILRDPGISDSARAAHKDSLERVKAGLEIIGGAYLDSTGTVWIDGPVGQIGTLLRGRYGTKTAAELVAAIEAQAHEYGHVIDGPTREFSNDPAWRGQDGAWTKDIAVKIGKTWALSEYAVGKGKLRPNEGFAEFSRLLYGTDIPTAQIARDFPNASKFFKDRGLWPPERGPSGKTGGPRTKLKEIFNKRTPDDPDVTSHTDGQTVEPGARSSTESASRTSDETKAIADEAGMKSTAEDRRRDAEKERAKSVVERFLKMKGLTDKEIDAVISRALGHSLPEIARREVVSPEAIRLREKSAREKLGIEGSLEEVLSLKALQGQAGVEAKQGTRGKARIEEVSGAYDPETGERMAKAAKPAKERSTAAQMSDQMKYLSDMLVDDFTPVGPEQKKFKAKWAGKSKEAIQEEYARLAEELRQIPGGGQYIQAMRLSDEPMSENERAMLRAIQEDPLDETKRLVMADVIEEGESPNASKRAAGIRRDIAPETRPGETGVSHPSQMHPEQRRKTLSDMDKTDRRSWEEWTQAEEEAGRSLKFKLDREALGEGTYELKEFGPRLYAHWFSEDVHGLLAGGEFQPNDEQTSLHTSSKGNHEAKVLFDTESIPNAWGSLGAESLDGKDSEVHLGDYYAGMRDRPTMAQLRKGILSVEVKEPTIFRASVGRGGAASEYMVDALHRLVKEEGWKRVKLPNGDTRFDSPLRQSMRAEQARGLRTGEPQFMAMSDFEAAFDKLKSGARSSTEKIKGLLKTWLTGPGDKPNTVWEHEIDKDNFVRVHGKNVADAKKDLTKAIGGDWPKIPQEERERMWRSRFVPAMLDSFPDKPEIKPILKRMWDHVDQMQLALQKAGVISEDLAVKLGHDGPYLTRQHMAFVDQANWHKNVSEKVKNQWLVYRANELRRLAAAHPDIYKEKTPDELQGEMMNLLQGKPGKEFINVLAGRSELPGPLSDLLGEVKDPIGSYAYTIGHQVRLLSNAKFIKDITDLGLKEGFLSDMQGTQHSRPIGGEKGVGPMKYLTSPDGKQLYADPVIADAIEGIFGPKSEDPAMLKAYMKILGAFKYGKTVLSPIAHLRQMIGNTMFLLRNGYTLSKEANRHIREIWDDNQDGRDYRNKLIQLNVLDQGVQLGEYKDVAKDALGVNSVFDLSAEMTGNRVVRALKKGLAGAEGLYRAEDMIVKIHGFENEKARYQKAHPEWTEQQVEAKAAEIINKTFPTYNRIPAVIRAIRRLPLMGPFVSFSSEMIRTTYNAARLGWSELKDPATRSIGTQRLSGLVGSMAAFAALSAASRALMGVSLEEEDSIRQMLPDWNKDGQLLHLGKDEKGKYRIIDLGRTDPHSFLWEPFQAGISGARSGTGSIYDTLEPLAKPFIGEELGTRVALDVARNKMELGQGVGKGQVYNPEGTTLSQFGDIAGHTWKGLEPGIVSQILRTGQAASGVKNPNTGKEYSVGEELLADFSGQRVVGIDPKESLTYKGRAYNGRMRNAEAELNQAAARAGRMGGPVDPAKLQGAFESSEGMRKDVFNELLADVRAARMMGMSEPEIVKALKDGGVPQKEIGLIVGGRYQERPIREALKR